MPSFERALQLTKSHYGSYPGPTKETYELAAQVAEHFRQNNVDQVGVIAVAKGSDATHGSYYYLGLSPGLQRSVMTTMCFDDTTHVQRSLSYGHFRLGRGLEQLTGVKFDLSRKVSNHIANGAKFNKGCAEKKVLSGILSRNEKLLEISVVAYPDTVFAESIPAHVVVGSADGCYIAPCSTCIDAYHG